MKGKYIPAIITLVAGLVASIVCLVKGVGIIKSLITLLLVLIIFYIAGRIVKAILVKTLQEPFEIFEDEDEDTIDTIDTDQTQESDEV